MVAPLRVARHGPDRSSAARRKTAARSSQGRRDQSAQASAAARIALSTSPWPPWFASARTWLFLCGITISAVLPVVTFSPPITSGSSIRSDCIWSSRLRSCSRSGEPGAYSLTGSFVGVGGRKMPGALIGLILRFRPCPQRTSATRRGVGAWGRSGSRGIGSCTTSCPARRSSSAGRATRSANGSRATSRASPTISSMCRSSSTGRRSSSSS